jgi:5'-deoxynucleotidase YfbR-like HD superfamily hydrolase
MLAISKKFSREHIYNLFAEFDDMKTNESVFANLIDKLESMLYVLTNNCADFTTNEQFEFIINYANNFINYFPELEGLIAEIKEQLTKIYNQFKKNADK